MVGAIKASGEVFHPLVAFVHHPPDQAFPVALVALGRRVVQPHRGATRRTDFSESLLNCVDGRELGRHTGRTFIHAVLTEPNDEPVGHSFQSFDIVAQLFFIYHLVEVGRQILQCFYLL